MADVQGTCDERFAGVQQAFEANLDSGKDVGAGVCVVLEGETVVDLWGGEGTVGDDRGAGLVLAAYTALAA